MEVAGCAYGTWVANKMRACGRSVDTDHVDNGRRCVGPRSLAHGLRTTCTAGMSRELCGCWGGELLRVLIRNAPNHPRSTLRNETVFAATG